MQTFLEKKDSEDGSESKGAAGDRLVRRGMLVANVDLESMDAEAGPAERALFAQVDAECESAARCLDQLRLRCQMAEMAAPAARCLRCYLPYATVSLVRAAETLWSLVAARLGLAVGG